MTLTDGSDYLAAVVNSTTGLAMATRWQRQGSGVDVVGV
jgi:hypothetical protein